MSCAFCRNINFRITLASIGVGVGIFAGVWFAGEFRSFNSASFALVSSIFASLTLILHVKYKRHTLHRWTPYLRYISILGCIGQLIGFTAFVTYIVLAIVEHQDLSQVNGENYWVSLVWGWMTWKWGFALFWYSRQYKREFERGEYQALAKDGDGGVKEQEYQPIVASSDGELIE